MAATLSQDTGDPPSQLSTSARLFSRALGLSSAKNAATTASPIADRRHARLKRPVPRLLDGARGVVRRGLDFSAALHRLGDAVLHQLPEQRQAGLRCVPMRGRDLRLSQSHQAIARFQCVIEEGELMVARERREPK
jgi:hypothetical protein